MPYAEKTEVPVERSKTEIEKITRAWKVTQFGFQWSQGAAAVAFEKDGWRVRMTVHLPPLEAFAKTAKGVKRTAKAQVAAQAQEERRRWRALALVIKAKIEAVQSDVSTFEEEFMAFLILKTGDTLGEHFADQLNTMRGGKMPPMLPR